MITVSNWMEAAHEWGRQDATSRLFQMDLLRRQAAGRLCEWFGTGPLESDIFQRCLGLEGVARQVISALPDDDFTILSAYASGVAAARRRWTPPSRAHALLGVGFEPWRPEDSILVLLSLYQGLALDLQGCTTRAIMDTALPRQVSSWLRASVDDPNELAPVPDALLDQLRKPWSGERIGIPADETPSGSNCWVVPPEATRSGGSLLACDTHLPLILPNIWTYVAIQLDSGEQVEGWAIPGLPIVGVGTNGHVAWGITNAPAPTADLIPVSRLRGELETHPTVIDIRGWRRHPVAIRRTRQGQPVLPNQIGGREYVLAWSALAAENIDLSLGRMARSRQAIEAMEIARTGRGLPLNLLATDTAGATVQTVLGGVHDGMAHAVKQPGGPPQRQGGTLISANDDLHHLHAGWNHPPAWRAMRLDAELSAKSDLDEAACHALQLDVRADHLREWQALLIDALPVGSAAHQSVATWNGSLDEDATGAPLIATFRHEVQSQVLSQALAPCTGVEPTFAFGWRRTDAVVLRLLRAEPEGLLAHLDTRAVMSERLTRLAATVTASLEAAFSCDPADLTWGMMRRGLKVRSLLAGTPLSFLFPSHRLPTAGDGDCVRSCGSTIGAVQRLVVSPSDPTQAMVSMLGGINEGRFRRHSMDMSRLWRKDSTAPLVLRDP